MVGWILQSPIGSLYLVGLGEFFFFFFFLYVLFHTADLFLVRIG